jgi:DNA-binding MarR family transcriptional regulator
MPSRPPTRALAAAAWRPLAQFFFDTARHRAHVLRELGLTPTDAKAMSTLDEQRGRSMSELADEWLCDASNATWIVDRLEERGLAERRNHPTDRRVRLVVLTGLGATTRGRLVESMLEPPPELLTMDRADLEALRDAAAKLPLASTSVDSPGAPEPARR